MSSSIPETFRAAVLTVSDSCARGERNDLSGPAVARSLQDHHFAIIETRVVADDHGSIQKAIVELARKARLVVTTGGTGISARDVTPEATRTVCGRMLDGISERMRREGEKKTPFAVLSRGVCGVCRNSERRRSRDRERDGRSERGCVRERIAKRGRQQRWTMN